MCNGIFKKKYKKLHPIAYKELSKPIHYEKGVPPSTKNHSDDIIDTIGINRWVVLDHNLIHTIQNSALFKTHLDHAMDQAFLSHSSSEINVLSQSRVDAFLQRMEAEKILNEELETLL